MDKAENTLKKNSFKPCCPNHSEPLEGLPFPLPLKGQGRCPISGCMFEYEVELDENKVFVDKFGKKQFAKVFKVEGNEQN